MSEYHSAPVRVDEEGDGDRDPKAFTKDARHREKCRTRRDATSSR